MRTYIISMIFFTWRLFSRMDLIEGDAISIGS